MLALLAAAAEPTSPWNFDFGVFGIGAIVFVLLLAVIWYLIQEGRRKDAAAVARDAANAKALEAKDKIISDLQAARFQDAIASAERYRDMQEHTLPTLKDTAKFLEASLTQARSKASQQEIDSTVTHFETLVEEMMRELRKQRDR